MISSFRINDPHGKVIVQNDKVSLEKYGDSKIILNGRPLIMSITYKLNHLDRILFGSSQYFVYYNPKEKNDADIIATYEMMQDEIALTEGLKHIDSNMSQGTF